MTYRSIRVEAVHVNPKPRAEGERVLYGAAHVGLTWLRTLPRPRFVLSLSFVRVVGSSACWLVVARRLGGGSSPAGNLHVSSWLRSQVLRLPLPSCRPALVCRSSCSSLHVILAPFDASIASSDAFHIPGAYVGFNPFTALTSPK